MSAPMPTRPAPRPVHAPAAPPREERRSSARMEQRRRRRHLQQLRRDFAADVIAAFVLTIFLLVMTAGLGVVALLELLAATGLIASVVIERRRRRRRAGPGPGPTGRRGQDR